MNRDEARALLDVELSVFRKESYAQLARRIAEDDIHFDRTGPSGAVYQVEIQCFWDYQPNGAIHVMGSIDDGGWSAFLPLTKSFIKEPDFDLARFVRAQDAVYAQALAEIRSGRKHSHWMWFIFPQYDGLGFSTTSKAYAIKSAAEARAYLAHEVLGPRLEECCEAALSVRGGDATEVFGSPDDMKLRSCATLFAAVSPPGSVFEKVLQKYFGGGRDERTLRLLGKSSDLQRDAPA